jgi:hypothetical protein
VLGAVVVNTVLEGRKTAAARERVAVPATSR